MFELAPAARGSGRGPGRGGARGTDRDTSRGTSRSRGRGSGRGHPPNFPSSSFYLWNQPETARPKNALESFVMSLAKQKRDSLLVDAIQCARNTWDLAWKEAAQQVLAEPITEVLVVSLTKIPVSADVGPPQITHVAQTLERLLKGLQQRSHLGATGSADDNEVVYRTVDLVLNAVRRLLKFRFECERMLVYESVQNVLVEIPTVLSLRNKLHRDLNDKISPLLDELDKPWTIKVHQEVSLSDYHLTTRDGDSHDPNELFMWNSAPKIGWLANQRFFSPLTLPVMEHPRSGGVYSSRESYFDTVIRIWTALSFGDGHAAISPSCKEKDAAGSAFTCDKPLWKTPAAMRQTCSRCGGSGGGKRSATYSCTIATHRFALCAECYENHAKLRRGPTGNGASTNIYDAIVVKVGSDGSIRLAEFASRKPPKVAIHWRSTRRLAAPNLVALVKTGAKGSALKLSDPILFGQLTNHEGKAAYKEETKYREGGFLCMDLINSKYSFDTVLKEGNCVAVIDCLSFAPDFVPVLKALKNLYHSSLPFHDGQLLNISPKTSFRAALEDEDNKLPGKASISSVQQDSDDSDIQDEKEHEKEDCSSSHVLNAIVSLINDSTFEPIVQIRRELQNRKLLIQLLVALVNETTLDPGQFKSFIASLKNPVHCTQGPPGTGKSYLGVVIVRSLLIIRQLWIAVNPSIGKPPILVLSYKNHAIDEFLNDLVQKSSS